MKDVHKDEVFIGAELVKKCSKLEICFVKVGTPLPSAILGNCFSV